MYPRTFTRGRSFARSGFARWDHYCSCLSDLPSAPATSWSWLRKRRGCCGIHIGTEHILLGLLREEEGLAARVLESLAINLECVRERVVRIVGFGEESTEGQIPFTPRAKKVLELALREALSLGHNYIGTEHILLGLVSENEGVAARILIDLDADEEAVRSETLQMLSGAGGGQAAERPTTVAAPRGTGSPAIDRAWFGGLGVVLDELAGEIRRRHQRAPDTGDLLLVLAGAPDTIAARALRELEGDLKALPDLVERLRAQECKLREQTEARTAIGAQALQTIRGQLGLSLPADNPPQPPQAS